MFIKLSILSILLTQHLLFSQSTEMVLINGGKFKPKYSFDTLTKIVEPYYIDKYLVTNNDFLKFVNTNSKWKKSKAKRLFTDKLYLQFWKNDTSFSNKANPNSPVVNVSWYAAKEYCECLGKRLPNTAEWELAWDNDRKNENDKTQKILDWYSEIQRHPLNNIGTGYKTTNGIYDLNSMIWEWTTDFNSVLISGESRKDGSIDRNLFCGGSSLGSANKTDFATYLRYAFRGSLKAIYSIHNLGFRCAKNK